MLTALTTASISVGITEAWGICKIISLDTVMLDTPLAVCPFASVNITLKGIVTSNCTLEHPGLSGMGVMIKLLTSPFEVVLTAL